MPLTQASAARPLVSVVMCTYNSGAAVLEAVDSVLAQTYARVELVVVDDGSTDGTPERLRTYGDRIRLLEQANGGIARARNAGMDAARGDYLAWFDHDDICEPQRIEWQLACMQQRPELVLCSSDFSAFSAAGPVSASHAAKYYSMIHDTPGGLATLYGAEAEVPLPRSAAGAGLGTHALGDGLGVAVFHGHVFDALAQGNFVHPPTIMMTRALWEQNGHFDPTIRIQCDYEWLLRASRLGEFGHIQAPLLRYRVSPTQISSSRSTVQSAQDIIEVVNRIKQWDPAYYQAHAKALRRRMGNWRSDAASVLVSQNQSRARVLGLIAQSVRDGYFSRQSLTTAVKACLPARVLRALRPQG